MAATQSDTPAQLQRKVITFITRKSPYGQGYARACLDMVLSAAVFDQQINYVFMDDGVLQLRRDQNSAAIDAKNLSAAFAALPLYDVENIYADAQSLQDRGMTSEALAIEVISCSKEQIATLLRQSDVVFSL